jgi:hypothetical protein
LAEGVSNYGFGGNISLKNQTQERYIMSDEKKFIQDDVVVEIKNKARGDMEFRKMLFDNPQEALGQFGFVIPGSSGDDRNYQETLEAVFVRADFYKWFNTEILSEFRDETNTMIPGPSKTATENEDVDWDFEVTTYKTEPG